MTSALTQVETVALWVGLLASVVSIVLAVVALAFTAAIDKRSRDVTNQTTKSLQKIESDVERISENTVGLIKFAWERLLGSVPAQGQDTAAVSEDSVNAIAAGVAAELRAESVTASAEDGSIPATSALLNKVAERVSQTLAAQSRPYGPRSASTMSRVVRSLESLPQVAREIARQLVTGGHLTRNQYVQLAESVIGDALYALRREGLLVALRGRAADGSEEPVYWFPPSESRFITAALTLVGHDPEAVSDVVQGELAKVGYPQPWLERHRRDASDNE